MCGIYAIFEHQLPAESARQIALNGAELLRHRGPDWSGSWADDRAAMAHERLAIVDPASGAQPLHDAEGQLVLAVNGEIYDHILLRSQFPDWQFRTASDCEVLLPLYRKHGAALVHHLRGMFAFALFDRVTGAWLVARDPMGIIPLYYGRDPAGALHFASEMKALTTTCSFVKVFPPGHLMTGTDSLPRRWHTRDWVDFAKIPESPADPLALRDALADAVRCHLMSDVPYGVLLSGGLDSSAIAALAALHAPLRVETGGLDAAWYPRLHSFSIGMEGSPDLVASAEAAAFIGTVHHGFVYSFQEGLDALSAVIRQLETFDVTTIRASTPMYLLARRIKAMGVKMVLSGEGADEIFGGYLYFHKAPDAKALHEECVSKLAGLHQYDCLRANKSMAAWGVEVRVPFLDTAFLDHSMRIHPRHKMCGDRIEKALLREACVGLLPDSIRMRQKEQFSDGVGYGWIDGLKAHAATQVSDQMLVEAAARFPVGTPGTKEAYFYRSIFEGHYPSASAAATVPVEASVACSTAAAIAWDPTFKTCADPSGRAVIGVHQDGY